MRRKTKRSCLLLSSLPTIPLFSWVRKALSSCLSSFFWFLTHCAFKNCLECNFCDFETSGSAQVSLLALGSLLVKFRGAYVVSKVEIRSVTHKANAQPTVLSGPSNAISWICTFRIIDYKYRQCGQKNHAWGEVLALHVANPSFFNPLSTIRTDPRAQSQD